MKLLTIFDMDGTLSDHRHRVHLVIQRPADFETYYKEAIRDRPIKWVAREARMAHKRGNKVIIVTNRPFRFYVDTANWLVRDRIPFEAIFMRTDDKDHRPTEIVKAELIERVKATYPDYKIAAVYEDRPKVIEKFRDMGLNVIVVGDGLEAG